MLACLALIAAAMLPAPSVAHSQSKPFTREVWSGADVSSDVWLIYSGATIAPYSGIHENGLRLRAVAGYGQYSYQGFPSEKKFDATTVFADVLAGYLYRLGPLTVKGFAGVSFVDHHVTPFDTENISIDGEWGPKGVIELWYNSGPRSWSSLDLAYTSAHDTASARMRSGYRIFPELSIGVEGAFNIDGQAQCKLRLSLQKGCHLDAGDTDVKSILDFGRTGLFVRYEWTGGEVSVSAGGLGRVMDEDGAFNLDPYVTANWIMQF